MPLPRHSQVGVNRYHTGYTGHFSLIGTYSRLRTTSITSTAASVP
jgi:hypothetical protein